ncbi:MAG: UDP-3-O-(3-hydroxymyristoyl)glucosamine N-acyltransferase [Planctomycetota bacterium]
METTVDKLSRLVEGDVIRGNKSALIRGINGIKEAQPGDITFLSNAKYAPFLKNTRATAVLVPDGSLKSSAGKGMCLIAVANPDLAFIKIAGHFKPNDIKFPEGVHASAVINKPAPNAFGTNRDKAARIAPSASIGAYAVIEPGATVGEKTIIYPHCYIGHNTKVGKNTVIYPNVSVREGCVIGDNCIIHGGAVIGSDGFGFTQVRGRHCKIPQLGNVVIEDDVEIGANCAIDRARFDKTVIRKGVKMDNLVHVAHNVEIGENTILLAGVVIAGSVRIGKNVIIAGHAGVAGHLIVGDNAVIAAKSGVVKNVPANTMVSGFPARPHKEQLREQALLKKLPGLLKKFSK